MKKVELAIVGSGPAGLSAACEAIRHGVETLLLEAYEKPGGQLVKQIHKFFGSEAHHAGIRGIHIAQEFMKALKSSNLQMMTGTTVWSIFPGNILGICREGQTEQIRAERIILVTGAGENALSFPGWTLPGVMTAGAAQTSMNINRVLPGRKVLMIGAGNVGCIIAYQLIQAGAEQVTVVEAKPEIGAYSVHSAKIARLGVKIYTSHTILEARGEDYVRGATIAAIDDGFRPIPGTEKDLDVDLICFACGLTPLSDLARIAKCRFTWAPALGGHVPMVNEMLETTVKGIYVAGDCGGTEEASTAIEEGRIAAISVAESLGLLLPIKAARLRRESYQRLDELRSGPYGQHRAAAKQKVIEEYKAYEQF